MLLRGRRNAAAQAQHPRPSLRTPCSQAERTQWLKSHPQLQQAAEAAQRLEASSGDQAAADDGEEEEEEEDLYTDRRWRLVQLQGVGQRWQQLVQQLGPEIARLQEATGEEPAAELINDECGCCAATAGHADD